MWFWMRLSAFAALLGIASCAPANDDQVRYYGADDAARETTAVAHDATTSDGAEPTNLLTRQQGQDWPCFLGPTGNGKSAETGIGVAWGPNGPKLVWHVRIGEGYGMPSISRGRLFMFDRVADRARLTCRNAETGQSLWEYTYPTDYQDLYNYNNGPRCSPVVDDDRVYVFGAEGRLTCVHAIDGAELWQVDTAKRFGVVQNFFGVGSTPIVEGDLLIVQVGGSPPEDQQVPPGQLDRVRSNQTAIVAFDKRTGEVKYAAGDELASYAGPVVATMHGRRSGFLFARGGLLHFDPATGVVLDHFSWRAPILESVNASNPIVHDDLVFISETYGLGSALLQVADSGKLSVEWSDAERRRDKRMQTHWNTPILHDGVIYGSSGRHTSNAELRAIDLATGNLRWSEPGLSRTSLLYVDGHLVVLGEYGELLLIRANPDKFDVVARATVVDSNAEAAIPSLGPSPLLKYPCWAAPILSHGLLYLRGDQRLVCLELISDSR